MPSLSNVYPMPAGRRAFGFWPLFLLSLGVFYSNITSATLISFALRGVHLFTAMGLCISGLSLGATFVYCFSRSLLKKDPSRFSGFLSLTILVAHFMALIGAKLVKDATNAQLDSEHKNLTFSAIGFLWENVHQVASIYLGIGFAIPLFLYGIFISYTFLISPPERTAKICVVELAGAALGTFLAVLLSDRGFPILVLVGPAAALLAAVFSFQGNASPRSPRIWLRSGMGLCLLFIVGTRVCPMLEPAPSLDMLARNYDQSLSVRELWHAWTHYARVGLLEITDPKHSSPHHIVAMGTGESHAWVVGYSPGQPPVGSVPSFLALALGKPKNALVFFAGAGRDLVEMDSHYPGEIQLTGVELNPKVREAALLAPGSNLDEFFRKPNIHYRVAENRAFLESDKTLYDVVLYSRGGTTVAYYNGTIANTSQFSLTCNAVEAVLRHLTPSGFAVIRDGNKLNHLACLRSRIQGSLLQKIALITTVPHPAWHEVDDGLYLIIKPSGFTKTELAGFSKLSAHGLSLVLSPYERNHPDLQFISAMVTEPDWQERLQQENAAGYDFKVHDDDHPFLFAIERPVSLFGSKFWSMRWQELKNHTLQNSQEGLTLLLCLLALLCIIGPVLFFEKRHVGSAFLLHELPYFSAIGFGHTVFQMLITHRFSLLLGNPAYAVGMGMGGCLVAYGAGSYYVMVRTKPVSEARIALLAAAAILTCLVFYEGCTPYLLSLDLRLRGALAFVSLLPVGFFAGQLYPSRLRAIAARSPFLVPLAVATDGAVSTVVVVAGNILLMQWGFFVVGLLPVFAYFALAIFIGVSKRPRKSIPVSGSESAVVCGHAPRTKEACSRLKCEF